MKNQSQFWCVLLDHFSAPPLLYIVRRFSVLWDEPRTPLAPVHLDFLQHFYASLSLSEDQSTNSIEASASSSSSSSRWAAAPRWVIVIWTVGPEWAGGWWGLKSLGPSAELLLLMTASRGEKCYFQARLYLSLNSTQLCCDKEATLVCVCLKVHQSFRCM